MLNQVRIAVFVFFGILLFLVLLLYLGFNSPLISKVIEKQIQVRLLAHKVDLKFESANLHLFPPAISLNKIKVNNAESLDENLFKVSLDEIKVKFGIFGIGKSKIIINSVELNNGTIKLELAKKKNDRSHPKKNKKVKNKEEIIQEIIGMTNFRTDDFGFVVNNIAIETIHFQLDNHSLNIESLKFSRMNKWKRSLDLKLTEIGTEIPGISKNLTRASGVYLSVEDTRKQLVVKSFGVQRRDPMVDLNLSFVLEKNLKQPTNIQYEIRLEENFLKTIFSIIESSSTRKILNDLNFTFSEGVISGTSQIQLPNFQFLVDGNAEIKELQFKYLPKSDVKAKLNWDLKGLFVEKISVQTINQGFVTVSDRVQLVPFPDDWRVLASASNLPLDDLVFLFDGPSPVKTRIDTNLLLRLRGARVDLNSVNTGKAQAIRIGKGSDSFVEIPSVDLKDFFLGYDDGKLQIKSSLYMDGQDVSFNLESQNGKMWFESPRIPINFEQIRIKSASSLQGSGFVSVRGEMNDEKNIISTNGSLDKISYLDKELGNLDFNLAVFPKKSELAFNKISIDKKFGEKIKIEGLYNYSENSIDSTVKLSDFGIKEYIDQHTMFAALDKSLNLNGVNGKVDSVYKIKGNFSNIKKIEAEAKIGVRDLVAYGESLDLASINTSLKNGKVTVRKFELVKNESRIKIDGEYSIAREFLTLKARSKNYVLQNLDHINSKLQGVSGDLDLKFDIEGKLSNLSGRGGIDIQNIVLDQIEIGSIKSDFRFSEKIASFNISGFEDQLKLKGNLDLSSAKTRDKRSFLDLGLSIDDWSKVVVFMGSKWHVLREGRTLNGNLDINSSIKFSTNYLEQFDLDFKSNKFNIRIGDSQVVCENNQLRIENGQVVDGKYTIKNGEDYFQINSSGDFKKKVNIEYGLKILLANYLNILEKSFFDSGLVRSEGYLKYLSKKSRKLNQPGWDTDFFLNGDQLSFSDPDVSKVINELNFALEVKDKNLIVHKIDGRMPDGKFSLSGKVAKIISGEPLVNINYLVDTGSLSIGKRSSLEIYGKGSLVGSRMPYLLNGDFDIQRLNLREELTDFQTTSKDKSGLDSIKFLPDNEKGQTSKILNLNVNLKNSGDLILSNSLASLSIDTNLHLGGDNNELNLVGQIKNRTNYESFVLINDRKFELERVEVNFLGGRSISDPDIFVKGSGEIDSYLIKATISGTAKNFDYKLESEPYLEEKSIFSLIAFGYDTSQQGRISESDRDSLSSAGLGGMLFRQLKLDGVLKDSLGLELNIGTEVIKNREQLASGDQAAASGEYSSATKIELKKNLTKEVDLSFSSTLSGSTGQRQSMNLNYDLDKDISLEGVYEMNTDNSNQNNRNDSSAGFDMKVKWEFDR